MLSPKGIGGCERSAEFFYRAVHAHAVSVRQAGGSLRAKIFQQGKNNAFLDFIECGYGIVKLLEPVRRFIGIIFPAIADIGGAFAVVGEKSVFAVFSVFGFQAIIKPDRINSGGFALFCACPAVVTDPHRACFDAGNGFVVGFWIIYAFHVVFSFWGLLDSRKTKSFSGIHKLPKSKNLKNRSVSSCKSL